jgi:RHS repeat-associated protein
MSTMALEMTSMTKRIRRWLTSGFLLGLSLAAPLAKSAETVTYYYTNQQGTPLATADTSGNILTTSDYRPYGSQALGSPVGGPGYTGHVNDPDSGLVYMQARYYDPVVGRFLSADPISGEPGSLRGFGQYEYANDNPLTFIDSDGRKGCQVGDTSYSSCEITVVYNKKTSEGTLTVTGKNKGDKDGTVLLSGKVVVGGDGHITPVGNFTAAGWETDHTSKQYGSLADVPWSKTFFGGNAFGPYQLHIKELDSRGIYIHGTMGPRWSPTVSISGAFVSDSSHGCVRMCNRDNVELHDIMPNPTGNAIHISDKGGSEDGK